MVKRTFGHGLGVFLLAVVVGAGAAETTGKLANPGFEADANGDGVPDNWERAGRLPEQMDLDKEAKKEGNASFRLSTTQQVDGSVWQDVAVEPGDVYRLTCWVKTEAIRTEWKTTSWATLSVSTKSEQKPLEVGKSHSGTTDWVKETVDFVAPKDGAARVSCVFARGGWASGSVWFDDLQLVRLAPRGGLGALAEPPNGCRPRAEWAIHRQAQDWPTLIAALEDFYANASDRDPLGIDGYLNVLCLTALADQKARACATQFYGRNALRMTRDDLARPEPRAILAEAAAPNEQDPELPLRAAPGVGRAVALHGEETVPEAIESIQRTLSYRFPQRRQLVAVLFQDARELAQWGPKEKAVRVFDILLGIVPPQAPNRADIESERMKALVAIGHLDKARTAAEVLVAPGRVASDQNQQDAFLTLVRVAIGAENKEDVAKWIAAGQEQLARTRDGASRFQMNCARAYAEKQQWQEAAAECQRLIASFPQSLQDCSDAQKLLVDCLIRLDRGDEAAGAAKVLYGAAGNSQQAITDAVKLAMAALKAKHRAIGPANAFAAFQKFGPDGPDGKKGTQDDVVNPFADIRWTPPPEVEAQFNKTLQGLPKDLSGLRARGYLYLYWGKPVAAIAEFARRYEQAPIGQQAADEAVDDLLVALKAHHGHTLAGEPFLDYLKYGPKGKDGKAGTNDDLVDPVAEVLKAK